MKRLLGKPGGKDIINAMPTLDLPGIRQRLANHQGRVLPPKRSTRQAAVAVILRQFAGHAEILFIKRAEKEGDPWSGQMAFPGGHLDRADPDLKAAAVRETWEEIGLNLTDAECLGALDQHLAAPRSRRPNLLIAPYAFALQGNPSFRPNYEVAEVVWAPLNLLAGNGLHHVETFHFNGAPSPFNGYRLASGHFIWGLTYRMLKDFFRILDPNWTPPAEVG